MIARASDEFLERIPLHHNFICFRHCAIHSFNRTILSDLAEHLDLRTGSQQLSLLDAAGLKVVRLAVR
jgi:hypothetical protein